MTNTVDEYWDADGVSLHTYAGSVESWGDTLEGVPPLRGVDQKIPFRPGELWTPKYAGPRTLTLAGWIRGTDAAGVPGSNPHGLMGDNWRAFRNLLWNTERQVALTKRWRDASGSVFSATAQVEYEGGLQPAMIGPNAAKYTVDLRLAFPYFLGTAISTGSHAAGTFVISNPGDDTTRLITLQFSAAATLTNNTTGKILTVPDGATINVDRWTTTGNMENINSTGQPAEAFWMSFVRGSNSMTLNTGSVTISFTPLYL